MIDLLAITELIKKYAPQAIEFGLSQAKKNESVITILKEFGLNPTEIPDNVDVVYAHALVEYGVGKPKATAEAVLSLLREHDIKNHFWGAYTSNDPFGFERETKEFLNKNPELKQQINRSGVELAAELEDFGENFISVAKKTGSGRFLSQGSYPDWDLDVFPKIFKALIKDKTRLFCGRAFVFDAFKEFLKNPKGYFEIIGDAGMGKSAISSKYVLATKCPCYFNLFAEGKNKPKDFLESIRYQLIRRYSLQNSDNADLGTLLQKASEQLSKGQKLVIVVDALDEVEHEGNGNLLDLPQYLPDGVYFFLTRRSYDEDNKRFSISPDTPYSKLDISLRDDTYQEKSREDIQEYINLFMKMDTSAIKKWIQESLHSKENSTKGEVITLDEWRQKQEPPISQSEFEVMLAEKSQNNFMYLRYVLPNIATGKYNDLSLQGLPEGLKDYYITHWKRMGMEKDEKDINAEILFILVVRDREVSSEMIAEILDKDIAPIEGKLSEWIEYLIPKKIEEDGDEKTYYSIYHRSFLDFLRKRPSLDEKKNKRRFQNVIDKIDEYFDIDF